MDNQESAFRDEVMRYQRTYPNLTVIEVAEHFGMHRKNSDIFQIQDILHAKEMRRYRKAGTGVLGPVKPGPNRSQIRTA